MRGMRVDAGISIRATAKNLHKPTRNSLATLGRIGIPEWCMFLPCPAHLVNEGAAGEAAHTFATHLRAERQPSLAWLGFCTLRSGGDEAPNVRGGHLVVESCWRGGGRRHLPVAAAHVPQLRLQLRTPELAVGGMVAPLDASCPRRAADVSFRYVRGRVGTCRRRPSASRGGGGGRPPPVPLSACTAILTTVA